MEDLIAFLTARYDEDEATARAMEKWPPGTVQAPIPEAQASVNEFWRTVYPARVRREVAAKRAIVAWHEPWHVDPGLVWCAHYWPCPTLRLLAAVYSDHPAYRQEWKP